jgi:K+-transporting ATPase ATPase C chain
MVTFDGRLVGSKLIAQEFKSDKLFHIRPASNSTSTVDPHITPDDAFAQVPRISKATGLPEYTLKTIIQFNIEKNKVTNVLVFAPPYVNVLEINRDMISGYPDIYHEFSNRSQNGGS